MQQMVHTVVIVFTVRGGQPKSSIDKTSNNKGGTHFRHVGGWETEEEKEFFFFWKKCAGAAPHSRQSGSVRDCSTGRDATLTFELDNVTHGRHMTVVPTSQCALSVLPESLPAVRPTIIYHLRKQMLRKHERQWDDQSPRWTILRPKTSFRFALEKFQLSTSNRLSSCHTIISLRLTT